MHKYTFIASIALVVAARALAAPPAYVVRDLGIHTGAEPKLEPGSVGAAIADGIAVGYAVTALEHRNFHAFRYSTALADLGVLAGDDHSIAFGVNAQGQAVGVSYTLGELVSHGVIWEPNGSTTALGNLEPHDINASGVVVGSMPVSGALGTSHATRWSSGVTTDLGTLGGISSMAFAVSDAGWIVGQSLLANNATTRAFLVADGGMINLGTNGGTSSRALDIQGLTVVGIADTVGNFPHATRWTLNADGTIASKLDLGTLPGSANSAAYGVNASGTIVGISGDAAFRWSAGSMKNLNAEIGAGSGWQLTRATGIDAAGRIVGVGKHFGLQRAFILTPRAPADFDADGSVSASDLALLLGAWGSRDLNYDLSGDGSVGADDLGILLGAWAT
jgi:probable HAF family extracellular repeat protein